MIPEEKGTRNENERLNVGLGHALRRTRSRELKSFFDLHALRSLRAALYFSVTISGRVLSMMARSSFCSLFGVCSLSREALRSPRAASNSGLVICIVAWVVFI